MMNNLLVVLLACISAVSAICYAQTQKPETSKLQSQPCVIVKRHVHKFGENMSRFHPHRPFDYVEGDYPQGFKWGRKSAMEMFENSSKKAGR
jgi:hypothetical protein